MRCEKKVWEVGPVLMIIIAVGQMGRVALAVAMAESLRG
jgi:hypothetical protein